jgi:hypothetical protein
MSLNDWSLVYFATSAIYMFGIFFSLFTKLTFGKILFVILAWIAHVAVTLVYGIGTGQIGFIFLFGLEVVMVLLMLVQFGRIQNANSDS